MKPAFLLILIIGLAATVHAKHLHLEKYYQEKWCAGQALYYAEKTDRRPGVLLIMEKETDTRYLDRLVAVANEYFIKVWTTGEQEPAG